MKIVLFIPGFKESIQTCDYAAVMKAIESKGYTVRFIPIDWQRTVIDDWVKEVEEVYCTYPPDKTILAGFSFGSMSAVIAAANRNPAQLWLFSLSPYFSDDIPKLKKSWLQSIGHRRVDAFKKINFNELAKQIACKTLLMAGEVEIKKYPIIGKRAEVAHMLIKNSVCVTVPNADHDVADKNYIQAIQRAV